MAAEIEIDINLNSPKSPGDALADLFKKTKKATKSLEELRKEQERLNEEFEKAKPGTDEYEKLRKELILTNKAIKDVELSIEALDTDQVASELGGLVGGLADVATGAVLAFGVSEESAEAFLQTLAQVEGAGRLVKGSIEGVQAGIKLYNNVLRNSTVLHKLFAVGTSIMAAAQTLYAAVVGTTTGALKALRIALAATGIGALVVGIGLLIANFETIIDFIDGAIDSLADMGDIVLSLLGPIGSLIKALDFLFDSGDAEERAEEIIAAEEKIQAALETTIALLEQQNDLAEKRAANAVRLAQAQGKSEEEIIALEREKLKTIGINAIAEESLQMRRLNSIRNEIEARKILGELEEEEAKEQQERLKAAVDAATQAQLARQDALFEAQLFEAQVLTDARKKEEDEAKKLADLRKKEREKLQREHEAAAKEAAKIENDRRINIIDQRNALLAEIEALEEDFFQNTLSDQEREIMAAQDKFFRLIELSRQNGIDTTLLEEARQQQLAEIREKFAEEEFKLQFEQDQRLRELSATLQELRISDGQQQFQERKQLSKVQFDDQLQELRFQLQTEEITEAEFRLQKEIAEAEHQQRLNEIEEEGAEFRINKSIEEANKKIESTSFFLDSAIMLNQAFNQIQDNLLKQNEELSLKQQRRRFIREKAFNSLAVIRDGAAAAVRGIQQFGPPPSPLGIAAITSAGLITAANLAAINSQQFSPNSSATGSLPNFSTSVSAPSPNIPRTRSAADEDFNTPERTKPAPIRAFVISGEVTDATEADRIIEAQSIF